MNIPQTGSWTISADIEVPDGKVEGMVVLEMRADLGPDNVARHQGASVKSLAKRLPRAWPEDRIGTQNIEENRRVHRRLQGRLGRGPLISSSRLSTGRLRFSLP